MKRRLVFGLGGGLAVFLAACLMTIDESKIDSQDASRPSRDGGFDGDVNVPPVTDSGDQEDHHVEEPDTGPPCDCPPEHVCRFGECTLPTSCKELLAQQSDAGTGVHTMGLDDASVPMYCDMTTPPGGWSLVYRVNAGQPGSPVDLLRGGAFNDTLAAEAVPKPTTKHYVSRQIDRWNQRNGFIVAGARVVLTDQAGAILRDLEFDATDSSRTSFFASGNVVKAPWTDLKDFYYFSIEGHEAEGRNFFINKRYNTCNTDQGWLLAHGTLVDAGPCGTTDPCYCPYENPVANVRIFYSSGTTATTWSQSAPEAKALLIFAR